MSSMKCRFENLGDLKPGRETGFQTVKRLTGGRLQKGNESPGVKIRACVTIVTHATCRERCGKATPNSAIRQKVEWDVGTKVEKGETILKKKEGVESIVVVFE